MSSQLYVRTVYSLLSSMCSVESIISKASEFGYKSIGIVDKNVLAGAMNFKKACAKANIKPIYGIEIRAKIIDKDYPCLLYAKNNNGFKNLMNLSSIISTSDEEIVSIENLIKYKNDNVLVLLSDDMPITYQIDNDKECLETIKQLIDLLGNDFLVGLTDHNIMINFNKDIKIKKVLNENNIKTIALNRTYYINKEDAYEFEILKCIRDKKTYNENIALENGRYFLNQQEFSSLYDDNDIKNTDVLSSICNVDINYLTELPIYPTPNNVSSKDYLYALANAGLNKRLHNNVPQEYLNRLKYELKVITSMHFDNYFLIVYDFIHFAKTSGIMVGPGRGSAAGSLVSYCLGITDVDPIKYGLLFERFLNPERVSMPDIDTDFPDDRRDEVFNYVKEKYGIDHVAHIVTYGTLKAKQALRDVGRVLKYSNNDLDFLTKTIPSYPQLPLDEIYKTNNLFRQKVDTNKKYKDLFNLAKKFELFPRHNSTHAAGIVFSKEKLSDIVPIIKVESDMYSTQYTMEHLEETGLIKMDFLGLRNLGIISEVVNDIKENVNKDFILSKIPLDDKKTFELIDNVNLLGVFQLESNGMQNLARKMKPKSFEELSMMIALFRPGPMDNIPEFLENRSNPNRIKYIVPVLKDILEETYGIIVYQEQIMTIARVLAGFSYGKADLLRRAMSKKKVSELEKLHDDFINGCINNGYQKQIANDLYELILKFANYGFNKSHSIAYGLIAYQMAYLKANYPLYFYKALLNGVIGSETKTMDYIKECINIGVKIKGVSINNSSYIYSIDKDGILMPFGVVKGVGQVAISKILSDRENGRYDNYLDTIIRLVKVGVEKDVLENLIYSGAFDEFNLTRNTMSSSLINCIKYANTHKNEINIFSVIDDKPIIENLNDSREILAEKEKKVFGFYFKYNPISDYKKKHNINVLGLNDIIKEVGEVRGFGLIRRIKEIRTRYNDLMAFVDISDDTGSTSLTVMPDKYKNYQKILEKDKYIIFEGKVERADSILVKKIEEVEHD